MQLTVPSTWCGCWFCNLEVPGVSFSALFRISHRLLLVCEKSKLSHHPSEAAINRSLKAGLVTSTIVSAIIRLKLFDLVKFKLS